MNVHEERAWRLLLSLGAKETTIGGKKALSLEPIRITSKDKLCLFVQAVLDVVGRSNANRRHVDRRGCPIYIVTDFYTIGSSDPNRHDPEMRVFAEKTKARKEGGTVTDLIFGPRDVGCDRCGSWPGQPCDEESQRCDEDRADTLRHFLRWLEDQRHLVTEKLTKKRIIAVAKALGYNTAENLSYRSPEVIVTPWWSIGSTGERWGLYVGGPIDPTRSVWMTSGTNLTRPERGPFRNEREIAVALAALGREIR